MGHRRLPVTLGCPAQQEEGLGELGAPSCVPLMRMGEAKGGSQPLGGCVTLSGLWPCGAGRFPGGFVPPGGDPWSAAGVLWHPGNARCQPLMVQDPSLPRSLVVGCLPWDWGSAGAQLSTVIPEIK